MPAVRRPSLATMATPRRHATPAARCPFDISTVSVGGQVLPVSQMDRLALPFGILTEFSQAQAGQRRILVVAPLAGGFPVLLRDLVIGLVRHADVAVTDWLDARYVPVSEGRFGFDENVNYVVSMMRWLGPDLRVVGVCQGVVPAVAATALIAAECADAAPQSLVLIGGPVDPLANPTRVVRLLRERSLQWFEDNVIETVPPGTPGQGRLVYPAKHQLTTLIGYLSRHMLMGGELFRKVLYDDGEDPLRFPFLQLCLRVMDLPAEFFLENIQHVYHDRSLCQGTLRVQNRPVDLRAISRTALMTVEGERDDIAGPGQTRAVHALCGSRQTRRAHLLVPECGHFSLFHGEAWRRRVLPEVLHFVK